MAMPVVEVRPVRMGVDHGVVAVPVGVPGHGGELGMTVRVVSVIVAVGVLVLERGVNVEVPVALTGEQSDAGEEECPGGQVNETQRLAEPRDGEDDAEERGAGEGDLGAGGTECLCRGDIEHDAEAIGPDADEKATEDGRGRGGDGIQSEPDGEVRGAGRQPLPEGALTGGDPVD